MTVSELIEKLKDMPQDAIIWVDGFSCYYDGPAALVKHVHGCKNIDETLDFKTCNCYLDDTDYHNDMIEHNIKEMIVIKTD